jgi:hypothetical protein
MKPTCDHHYRFMAARVGLGDKTIIAKIDCLFCGKEWVVEIDVDNLIDLHEAYLITKEVHGETAGAPPFVILSDSGE